MTVAEYANRGIDWNAVHGCGNEKCGGMYLCSGCEREVGYCSGAHDELEELCDDCAMVVVRYRQMFNPEQAAHLHDVAASGVFLL